MTEWLVVLLDKFPYALGCNLPFGKQLKLRTFSSEALTSFLVYRSGLVFLLRVLMKLGMRFCLFNYLVGSFTTG